jgi:hypothetical protein
MPKRNPKSIERCIAVALISILWALPCRVLAAGGAYAVDDADIGKPGSCQNEAWTSAATSRDFVAVESPACVVNKSYPIELTAMFQRTRTASDWATAFGLQAKAVPINTDKIAVSWALSARSGTLLLTEIWPL